VVAPGHRIKYWKVDADTGEEVPNEDIVKGYQIEKDQFIEVTNEELEEIALESTRTIKIDEFEFERRLNCGRRARRWT
jgi:DNA end-binding protein Ku